MHDDYRIELFIFPDGTSVEMIVFEKSQVAQPAPQRSAPAQTTEAVPPPCDVCGPTASAVPQSLARTASTHDSAVHVCPLCGSEFVQPLDWQREGESIWHLIVRCPNCDTRRAVDLDRGGVERFNRELYRGAQVLTYEAERLSRQHFEEEAEKLVFALRHDLILPIDF
jgi:hypothetical protein